MNSRSKNIYLLWIIPGMILLAALAAWSGYKLGTAKLETGVPLAKMAKVGLQQKLAEKPKGATISPIWLPDGNRFVYNAGDKAEVDFRLFDPNTANEKALFDKRELLKSLSGLFNETIPPAPFPIKTISFIDADTIQFTLKGRQVQYHLSTNSSEFLTRSNSVGIDPLVENVVRKSFPQVWDDEKEKTSPNRQWVLSADAYNLLLRSGSGKTRALTTSGKKLSEWNLTASHWSPNSQYVATLRADINTTTTVPVVDWLNIEATIQHYPYPMAMSPLMDFEGAIIDIVTGKKITIDFGAEVYIRPLQWRPDNSEFLYARLSRDVKLIEILAVSPKTGEIRVLLSEKTDSYHIFPANFIYRNGPDFYLLPDNRHFTWISDKSGFRQLYLHTMSGEAVTQLTNHPYPVANVGGYDKENNRLLYTARSDKTRPYDIHVHSVNLFNKEFAILSDKKGQHTINVSPSGQYYIDKYSTTAAPPVIELRTSSGELVKTLYSGTQPMLAKMLAAPAPEHFSALAADGKTEIYGVIFKPADFDPAKKYPVIDAIYGGAFLNHVPYTYDARVPFFGKNLTEMGFIVAVVDARGTPGRSKAFKDTVYGKLGQFEIADHVAALKSAAQYRPWMDLDRVGVIGHSFGGYFATRALLQAPDFYKVGVASGIPEMDKNAVSISNEVYLGLYNETPENYKAASNVLLADQLQGHLLLVVQTSDVNTPAHGAFKLIDAFIKHKKPYDLLLLPGANHKFAGTDRRYFFERFAAYFIEHL